MRILRNLEASLGGGTPAEPVLNVTATPPPKAEAATPPPAPPAPNPLAADLAATRARLAELEKAENDRTEQARLAEEEKLKAKGEFEKLIKQRDERLAAETKRAADAEERSKSYALDSQLAMAFSGHDLYEGSAEDLSVLWRKDFEVVLDGDKWAVRSKDGRPVKDVIAERLALPRYSNHVKATSRSGASGGGGGTPAPTQTPDPAKVPTNWDEYQRQVLQIDDPNRAPFLGLSGRRAAK